MYTNTPYSHVCFKGNVPRLGKERQRVMICAHSPDIPKGGRELPVTCQLLQSLLLWRYRDICRSPSENVAKGL